MSYSLSLQARLDTLQTQEESEDILLIFQDFVSSHHPSRVPYSSRTVYTNQFIKSYDDYEQELRNVYQGSFQQKKYKKLYIFGMGKMTFSIKDFLCLEMN